MKKGQTSGFLLGVILSIIGFLVVLGFLYFTFIAVEETFDKHTCRSSVIARDAVNLGDKDILVDAVPLKCKTEKICIRSKDSGNCVREFGKEDQSNPVRFVRLDENDDIAKVQILDTFARAMYDCHWMLGEGERDFLKGGWISPTKYCIICSRVIFDIDEERGYNLSKELSMMDLLRYLDYMEDNEGRTFFEAIYKLNNSRDLVEFFNRDRANMIEAIKKEKENRKEEFADLDIEEIERVSLTQISFLSERDNSIVASFYREGSISGIFGVPLILGAASIAVGGVGAVLTFSVVGSGLGVPLLGASVLLKSAAISATFVVAGGSLTGVGISMAQKYDGKHIYSTPTILPSNSVRDLECDSFENIP